MDIGQSAEQNKEQLDAIVLIRIEKQLPRWANQTNVIGYYKTWRPNCSERLDKIFDPLDVEIELHKAIYLINWIK